MVNRRLPKENILARIQKWGLLKNVTINPPKGTIYWSIDLASSAMFSSTLNFRRDDTEKVEKDMKRAFDLLKYGEPYNNHPFFREQIIDGRPNPEHWQEGRDSYRFSIELYNSLTREYQEKRLQIRQIHIENGRLEPVKTPRELEAFSFTGATL